MAKHVVIDECILACLSDGEALRPVEYQSLDVQRASVIRGASHIGYTHMMPVVRIDEGYQVDTSRVRPATLKDFEDYMVSPPPEMRN